MDTTVLVLCANDRCLAPAAATVLRSALQAHGEWQVQVVSAGVRAEVGRGWCTPMSEQLTKDHDLSIRPHRAQQVTAELVRSADLVLVSERRYRGSTRLFDASSASHTFTLVEAAVLARAALDKAALDRSALARAALANAPTDPTPTDQSSGGSPRLGSRERLMWLLEEMDAMRGLVTLPEEPRGWRGRFSRPEVNGLDILDPDGDRGSHRKAVPALRQASDSFASSLADASPRTVSA